LAISEGTHGRPWLAGHHNHQNKNKKVIGLGSFGMAETPRLEVKRKKAKCEEIEHGPNPE
jgi:hypothetical protein